jgi:hypothetical protein
MRQLLENKAKNRVPGFRQKPTACFRPLFAESEKVVFEQKTGGGSI